MTWIQTLDGKAFDLAEPSPNVIDPHTLAVVLARQCRFGGHCRDFYSVAQHSVFVASLVPPSLQLPALLHDAHEAYWGFGDVLRPAKHLWGPDFAAAMTRHQRSIDAVIAERFGINPELMQHPAVKHADNVALATEARDVMLPPPQPWAELPEPFFEPIEPQDTDEAYRRFMARLYELWGE